MTDTTVLARDPEVRELRLALVCYGGVSLAIYMHGITKELQALVVASRAVDAAMQAADSPAAAVANPFRADQSERAYFDQLVQLWKAKSPLSVTIDIVSGTSAGGINGVCLSKALVQNSGQDGLTDLWMRRGDLEGLLRYRGFGLRDALARTLLALPWMAGRSWSPLRGDRMCDWLFTALRQMDTDETASRVGSLLPPGGSVDLFVTATDLRGYERVVIPAPGDTMRDRTYRKVFRFRHAPGVVDQIGRGYAGALAFAARATSSFPGAFPPIDLDTFAASLGPDGSEFVPDAFAREFLKEYPRADDARATAFVDGGVLDNSPFDHAVDAILHRPAETEVTRHLVYIEPDPSVVPPAGGTADEATRTALRHPTWFSTVWSALSTIPHHQPILGSLLDLQRLNEEVGTLGRMTARLEGDVLARLDATQPQWAALSNDHATISQWAQDIYDQVPQVIGPLNYRTYGRLKMAEIGRRLAADLAGELEYPPESSQASFLRAALGAWIVQQPQWSADDDRAVQDWLGPLDIPYRQRRLMFIIAGVNALFAKSTLAAVGGTSDGLPSRAELAAVKKKLWDLMTELLGQPAAAVREICAADPKLTSFVAEEALTATVTGGDPARWAAEHDSELHALVAAYTGAIAALTRDASAELWNSFQALTASWGESSPARCGLAARYVGFPLWDGLLFPVMALSRQAMLSPVHVSRFSPRDATALEPPPTGDGPSGHDGATHPPKLKGTAVHHFGGFFELDWRENDYLWGRLDAVEMILALLRKQYPADAAEPLPDGTEHLRSGLTAVLDAEQPKLGTQGKLLAYLRARVADLPRPAVPS